MPLVLLSVQLRRSISLWYDAHSLTPDKQSHTLPSMYNTQISWEQNPVSLCHILSSLKQVIRGFSLCIMLKGDVKFQIPIYFKIYRHSNYGSWVFTSWSLVVGVGGFPVVSERNAASFLKVAEIWFRWKPTLNVYLKQIQRHWQRVSILMSQICVCNIKKLTTVQREKHRRP